MSDDTALITESLSQPSPPGRSPKDVHTLSMDRVVATWDRLIGNRMREIDRYSNLAVFRESAKAFDSKARPGDTPPVQAIFEAKALYDQCDGIEDLKDRLTLKAKYMAMLNDRFDHYEEQKTRLFGELKDLKESYEGSTGNGKLDLEQLLKDAK